ncbi:sensor histidine kinase [Streptomyces diacarni]|uniref:ATP-binding protein n=1 Tax=Streptomyces diacarni TaxID=2800381 RepID=UPI0015F04D00|nr:ATP-binding protein [Streptomyces diacarni]
MRENVGDAAVRRRLVRLAVLPAGLVALTGAAVVVCVLRGRGGAPLGAPVWGVLAAGAFICCVVPGAAAYLAAAEARGTAERCAALRRATARGQAELKSMLWALRHGERPVPRTRAPQGEPVGDGLDLLVHQAALAQCGAEAAVAEAVALMGRARGEGEEKMEVFVNLARRLQSLVHREIRFIDDLEHEVEDPDLLKGVFHVDHLATRIRRHSENLAVLGGAVAHRQWTRPVSLSEVLRSSVAEVEHYTRVQLVPPIEGAVRGHAVADVIHLLAELIENATVFSAPETRVLVRTEPVTAGLAVEVEDRGLGMDPEEQNQLNAVLADPEGIDVPALVRDGRIGLYVVAALAHRHGVVVQLQNNIYGGVQAVAVLPRSLLGEPAGHGKAALPNGGRDGGGAGGAGPAAPPAGAPATTLSGAAPAGAAPHAGSGPGGFARAGTGSDPGEARLGAARPGAAPSAAAGPAGYPGAGAGSGPGAGAGSMPGGGASPGPGAGVGPGPGPGAGTGAEAGSASGSAAHHAALPAEQGRALGEEQGAGDADAGADSPADPRPRARARGGQRGPATPAPLRTSGQTESTGRPEGDARDRDRRAPGPPGPAGQARRAEGPGEVPGTFSGREQGATAAQGQGQATPTGRGQGAAPRRGTDPTPGREAAPAQGQAAAPAQGRGAASPQGRGAAEGEPLAGRPPLPRRRRQTHLAPELREPLPPAGSARDEGGHDPGLMAAFRRGSTLAHGIDHPAGGHPPPHPGEERDHGE